MPLLLSSRQSNVSVLRAEVLGPLLCATACIVSPCCGSLSVIRTPMHRKARVTHSWDMEQGPLDPSPGLLPLPEDLPCSSLDSNFPLGRRGHLCHSHRLCTSSGPGSHFHAEGVLALIPFIHAHLCTGRVTGAHRPACTCCRLRPVSLHRCLRPVGSRPEPVSSLALCYGSFSQPPCPQSGSHTVSYPRGLRDKFPLQGRAEQEHIKCGWQQ